jgi:murein DD-endopeptidase MepM/ murein hydrolase activator NlpD
MKVSTVIATIVITAALALGFFYFKDTTAPMVSLSRQGGAISAKTEVVLTLRDPGAGLKNLTVTALQGDRSVPLLSRLYPPGTHEARESFRIAPEPHLKEGPFKLQVTASDRAVYHLGAGNSSVSALDFNYQNKPPAVVVLSTAHNISRGGSGLAVYSVDREVEKTGVIVNDRFFPGYRQSDNLYACLFAFPYNMPAEQFVPKVLAVDRAGNERRAGIYFHLLPKSFRSDRIELSDAFLEKVASEFKDRFPQATTPLEVFLKANRELRDHDVKILAECGLKTSPVPLWEGDFLRMPNSAPRGVFAQFRSYYYHGKMVDQQTHLGIDLASLAHAQVPAANRGKVVYADDLGIYGQCVIIDHGLGLQSLYGHLSRIAVKVGDEVKKGQIIGNTGDTGLAGGDHLHFGVVVSGEQVNPIEWWDLSWIKNNVTDKLEDAKQSVPTR